MPATRAVATSADICGRKGLNAAVAEVGGGMRAFPPVWLPVLCESALADCESVGGPLNCGGAVLVGWRNCWWGQSSVAGEIGALASASTGLGGTVLDAVTANGLDGTVAVAAVLETATGLAAATEAGEVK